MDVGIDNDEKSKSTFHDNVYGQLQHAHRQQILLCKLGSCTPDGMNEPMEYPIQHLLEDPHKE